MPDEKSERLDALLDAQRYDDALPLCLECIERDPENANLWYLAGQCYRFTGDFENAVRYLSRSLAMFSGEVATWLALGIALQLSGRLDDAAETLRRGIERFPDNPYLFNSLGMTRKLQGMTDRAINCYQKVIRLIAEEQFRNLKNARSSPIAPECPYGFEVWLHAALAIALEATARDGCSSFEWPTGEMAIDEERTHRHEGLYWTDHSNAAGSRSRLFLPNYTNTMFLLFARNRLFGIAIGNLSTVLEMEGRLEEAEKHRAEALFFESLTSGT